MAKNILVVASHPGGANAIRPAAQRLKEQNYYVVLQQTKALVTVSNDDVVTGKSMDSGLCLENLVDQCKGILDSHKPDAILMGTASQKTAGNAYLEQAYTLAAREKGIPAVAVVDLPISEVERFSDIYDEKDGKFKFLPDKICVDSIAYNRMLEQGFPAERLVVTGNPYFDDIGTLRADHQIMARCVMGVNEDDFVIVYASDIKQDLENYKWGFTDADAVTAVCEGIKRMSGKNRNKTVLVLKKHTREEQANFDRLCQQAFGHNILLRTSAYNTRHDVWASNLVTGIVSTVLLEATLMNRNAISLQPNPERAKTDDYFLNTQDIIPHAYTAETCRDIVYDAIMGGFDFWQPYMNKRQGLTADGNATERVVEVVKSMIK